MRAVITFHLKENHQRTYVGLYGLCAQNLRLVTGEGTITQAPRAKRGINFTHIVLPVFFLALSYISVYSYKMTKKQHEMIRAAIAEKHKTGKATLTDDEKRQLEEIAGHKFEDMWIGQDGLVKAAVSESTEPSMAEQESNT